MDKFIKKVLTRLQQGIPLISRPFALMADELRSSEEDLIVIVLKLIDEGKIREISAVFQSDCLGYRSILCAAKVEDKKLDETAEFINLHPGVTHNYRRDNEYNLWFTLTVTDKTSIDKTLSVFSKREGVVELLDFPKEKTYKIRVALNLNQGDERDVPQENKEVTRPDMPDEVLKKIVVTLQDGIPISREPFDLLAKRIGMSEEEFISNCRLLEEHGVIRRIPAMLRHSKVGIMYNALVVWNVEREKLDEIGQAFSKFNFVTHCYERKSHDRWSYNLYTMTHATDEKTWESLYKQLLDVAGSTPHLVLKTLKEYKKTRMRYFDPAFDEWNRKYLIGDE